MAHAWYAIDRNPQKGLHYRKEESTILRQHAEKCLKVYNIEEGLKAMSLAISNNHEIIKRYKLPHKEKKKLMNTVIEDVKCYTRLHRTIGTFPIEVVKPGPKLNDLGIELLGWRPPKNVPSDLAKEGMKKFYHCVHFPDKKSDLNWDAVVGHEDIKEYIEESLIFPQIYGDLMPMSMRAKGVLLYGPPGTGKTMIAHAIATKMEICYIEIKAGELLSKWLGESEGNVRAFYAMVEYLLPCILFIDEIDSIAGRRSTDSETPESRRGISNQMLQDMENKPGLFMVAATNMPWQIDPAFLRRIGKKCYVKLPDNYEIGKLLENNLKDMPHSLLPFEISNMAKAFEGYSSSDICEYIKEVRQRAFRKLNRARFFAKNEKCQWYACSALNLKAEKTSAIALRKQGETVLVPNLTCRDFEAVPIGKTSNEKDIQKYAEFFASY